VTTTTSEYFLPSGFSLYVVDKEGQINANVSKIKSHLIGNVYARFKYEDSAQKACDALNSRWYSARPIYCELSPVTDFREACCRLNSGEGCVRGGFCNFIHRKNPSDELERELELSTKKWLRERGRDERSMSRSPSPEPTRKRYA